MYQNLWCELGRLRLSSLNFLSSRINGEKQLSFRVFTHLVTVTSRMCYECHQLQQYCGANELNACRITVYRLFRQTVLARQLIAKFSG